MAMTFLTPPVATVVSALIIAATTIIVTGLFNRTKIKLDVTKAFTEQYWEIVGKTLKIDEHNALPLLGLVSEQLFQMKKGYVTKELAKEWLYGMIDYMPLFGSWQTTEQGHTTRKVGGEKRKKAEAHPLNYEALINHCEDAERDAMERQVYQPFIMYHHKMILHYPRTHYVFTLGKPFEKILGARKDFITELYSSEDASQKESNRKILVDYLWQNIKDCPI